MSFQVPNGVIDILCKDEEEATDIAKKYLSYFQGPIKEWGRARSTPPAPHRAGESATSL